MIAFSIVPLLFQLNTCQASEAIAKANRLPWAFRRELVGIARRESHCQPVGIHDRDRSAARLMYRKARRKGLLRSDCPHHEGHYSRFGVRGGHGLSAAYTMRFLPCMPPEVLDIPIFSAYAAMKRMQAACKRYGACDKQSRRRLWAGARNYDRRNRKTDNA